MQPHRMPKVVVHFGWAPSMRSPLFLITPFALQTAEVLSRDPSSGSEAIVNCVQSWNPVPSADAICVAKDECTLSDPVSSMGLSAVKDQSEGLCFICPESLRSRSISDVERGLQA